MPLRTVFLWTLIGSLALAAAMGVAAILLPGMWFAQERILGTSLLVGVFSLPALACSIVMGKKRLVWFMWTGIGSTFSALALWLPLIWIDFWRYPNLRDVPEFLAKAATPLTVTAALAMQIGLLTLLRLDRRPFQLVFLLTRIASIILGVMICLVVWTEAYWLDGMAKAIAIAAILSACGTVVTPVLALIDMLQRRGSRESIAASVKIDLTCPRCRHQQTLPSGPSRCERCGLRIDIDVEEPRCECGYLLYQLQSDKCPECGKPVQA